MKNIVLTFLATFFALFTYAQSSPVSFTSSAVKKGTGVYEITITAKVPSPWHIYSQNTPEGGPSPTTIEFSKNPLVTPVGKTREVGSLKKVYDKNFKTNVLYFDGDVKFVQLVKVKGNAKTTINANIDYMVCDDHKCLPPTTKTVAVKLQ